MPNKVMDYDEILNKLAEATNDFSNQEGGEIEFSVMSEVDIAVSILLGYYLNIEVNTIPGEDGAVFNVSFDNPSDNVDEGYRLKRRKMVVPTIISPNKNPEGTPIGNGTGMSMGEDLDDLDNFGAPERTCPECGEHMSYIGGQGDYEEYNCDNCGAWAYYDYKGNYISPDEAWNEDQMYRDYIKDTEITEKLEKHDELNPDLFDENSELKPEVKDKLLEIADKFKENLENDAIELDIKDILFVGSNASYNYNDMSDIDLHILADLSVYKGKEDLAEKLYQAYKTLWNNKYDPTIYGHEVEVYVEPYEDVVAEGYIYSRKMKLTESISNGIYSLYNGWIKQPKKDIIPDGLDVSKQVSQYKEDASQLKTIKEIDKFIDDLYILRQSSLISGGEFSDGNLIFKELRNDGILQELKDKKIELQNKEMSIK